MGKANVDIRAAIKNNNLKIWQVADRYGLCDGNFSRKLRKELPDEEKKRIFDIIKKMAVEQQEG